MGRRLPNRQQHALAAQRHMGLYRQCLRWGHDAEAAYCCLISSANYLCCSHATVQLALQRCAGMHVC